MKGGIQGWQVFMKELALQLRGSSSLLAAPLKVRVKKAMEDPANRKLLRSYQATPGRMASIASKMFARLTDLERKAFHAEARSWNDQRTSRVALLPSPACSLATVSSRRLLVKTSKVEGGGKKRKAGARCSAMLFTTEHIKELR